MLKRSFFVVVTVLLLVGTAKALIVEKQGFDIGMIGGLNVDGTGVGTEGTVINVDNQQNAMNLGRCGNLEVAYQKQSVIGVEGGVGIGTNPRSDVSILQYAGASGEQDLLVGKKLIIGSEETDLCIGQVVYADDGGAGQAGQGLMTASVQAGGNNNAAMINGSITGVVNTSSAIAGPCSEVTSGNAVTVETVQATLVL